MALRYDTNIFNKFRDLAITDASQLHVGQTYYTNSYPDQFTVIRLETDKRHRAGRGLSVSSSDDDTELRWVVVEDGIGSTRSMSLYDHNVGSSYNPWLIFDNCKLAQLCRDQLEVVVYSSDNYDDIYDYMFDSDSGQCECDYCQNSQQALDEISVLNQRVSQLKSVLEVAQSHIKVLSAKADNQRYNQLVTETVLAAITEALNNT